MLDDRFRSALGFRAGDEEVVCELGWGGEGTARWESGILVRLRKLGQSAMSEERVLDEATPKTHTLRHPRRRYTRYAQSRSDRSS